MKKVLYMHTGSANHGCEAIIRTTSKLLDGPNDLILWSKAKAEDIQYGTTDKFEKVVISEQIPKFSIDHLEAMVKRRCLHNKNANLQIFLRRLFKDNVAISVGGDNYCYEWSARQAVELDKEIRKYCRYSVLWGCSINPEAVTPEVREDLSKFDLITAREPITYDLLKTINPNTVKVADPAFLLERVDLPLPDGFQERNTVGINISPLIMKYGIDEKTILESFRRMIRYILESTDMSICFIPHVVWPYNNDLESINLLFEEFKYSDRVCKINDGRCNELKGYIARCRFFVGARTHATIAAYSSEVPTLAVGYSVKSKGIAQDLFGTDENYVLPVQELSKENELVECFKWIEQHELELKKRLKKVIPAYREQARLGTEYLQKLMKAVHYVEN